MSRERHGVVVLHILCFLAWFVSTGNVVAFGSRTVMAAAPTKYCLAGCQFSQLNAHHCLIILLNRLSFLHRNVHEEKPKVSISLFLVKR